METTRKPTDQSLLSYIPFEREFYSLKMWFGTFSSYFESFKSYGGLNVIIKVWIDQILSKFKGKWLANQQSKVYKPTYNSKENFMLNKFNLRLFFRILNRSKVMVV